MVIELIPLLEVIGTIIGALTKKWVIVFIGIILLVLTLGGASIFTGIPLWILLVMGLFLIIIFMRFRK